VNRAGGRPLWGYVAALLAIALLGTCAYAAATMTRARSDVAGAERERAAVHVMVAIEAAQDALGAELTPSMVSHLLGSARTIPWLGVDSRQTARNLTRQMVVTLADTRGTTDELLSAALQASADPRLSGVVAELPRVRAVVDQTGPGAAAVNDIVRRYLDLGDRLDGLQRDTVVTALAESGNPAGIAALEDMRAVAAANRAASRQLPALVLRRLAPQLAAEMEASALTWAQAAVALDALSSASLRVQWESIRATNPLAGHSAADALGGSLDTGQLDLSRGLALTSSRATTMLRLLYSALTRADTYTRADAAAAAQRLRQALGVAVALGVMSTVAAIWVGLLIARPLRRLAGDAQQIRDGRLVDVGASGPREVRMVSVALGSTVEGLRRLQSQAACVARGDLGNPVLSEPVAGPLGRVVHASIEMIVSAVRESERLQAQLAHRAVHDELTGLLNRAGVVQQITVELADDRGGRTALLFIDLDAFKAVNDSLGHAAGDSLLRTLAARFTAVVGADGVVARLGGDEFVVLLPSAADERAVVDLAERLVRAAGEPVVVPTGAGPQRALVGASVGVAVARDEPITCDVLLAAADAAVYEAKAQGRGCVRVFDGAMQARQAARVALEEELTVAIRSGSLQVEYQQMVDVESGRTIGWEALARWDRPGHGVLTAQDFVPLAEMSSLSLELDRWVLREGLAQRARWAREGEPVDCTLTVNLSSRLLSDIGVVGMVRAALQEASVPAQQLVIDVHEDVLSRRSARSHLAELRQLGVQVAVDDFGRGYLSMGRLDGLPIDMVKLEPDLLGSAQPASRSLVRAMVDAAHAVGVQVIAECVDSADSLDALREQTFDAAQGFLVSRMVTPRRDAQVAFAGEGNGEADTG